METNNKTETVHVTAIRGEGVYGHDGSGCGEDSCGGKHELYYRALKADDVEVQAIYEISSDGQLSRLDGAPSEPTQPEILVDIGGVGYRLEYSRGVLEACNCTRVDHSTDERHAHYCPAWTPTDEDVDHWYVPPARQGQTVERAYGTDAGIGWQRILDRSDRTVRYERLGQVTDSWDPVNTEPGAHDYEAT